MKFHLPSAITTRVAHQTLKLQKNSPKLLFVSGIALMGATVVTSSRATLSLGGVLEDIRDDRDAVKDVTTRHPEKYSEKEIRKLHAYITFKGSMRIVKLYLPAISLGVASIACLTTSHNQLTRRNAGLSAALAATERALESYRDRVREAYGEDREEELWRGEKTETVYVDGKKTNEKIKVGGGYSPYARAWGQDTTTEWDPQPEYNLPKLRSVQEWCTIKLNSKGHLFLNEVHDELGLDRTPAGQVVGWLSKKNGGKDGYVDLGVLVQGEDVAFRDFITGHEAHIMLDFNVDGEIWRLI